jgi:uncharacterized surface protein with fasciclin (FAS1) repeats
MSAITLILIKQLNVMETIIKSMLISGLLFSVACSSGSSTENANQSSTEATEQGAGQSAVQDDVSNPNVVQVAVSSKDHSTLVAAVKAAELVDALSNAGPFTVFAPTNAAFDALPEGTVESLLTPEKKDALIDILQYHVSVGVYKLENLQDGQSIGQVNGGNIKITKKGEDYFVNDVAKIVGTVEASNGVIYVVDQVLVPGQ